SSNHPRLPAKSAFEVLALIANWDRGAAHRSSALEKLLKLRRIQLEQAPSEIVYVQIADTENQLHKFADAAATIEGMIAKYPNQQSDRVLSFLADFHHKAGHNEAARRTLKEALKADPTDEEAQTRLARVLSEIGELDTAARVLREAGKREPNNWHYELRL